MCASTLMDEPTYTCNPQCEKHDCINPNGMLTNKLVLWTAKPVALR